VCSSDLEILVLAVVTMVFGEHLPKHFGQFGRLFFGSGVILALPMVANCKPGTAAVAKLKGFDRICRVPGQFLIEYRNRTVYVIRHVILRWVEDSWLRWWSVGKARHGALPGLNTPDRPKSNWKRVTWRCGIRMNL
jgi:hypothetical protein